jgi:peptide/nickel transport system substrate-binding protein
MTAATVFAGACTGGSGSSGATVKNNAAGLYGTVPPTGVAAASGGTITIGQISGSTPTWIFPITPSANGTVETVYQFEHTMFNPLYFPSTGSSPVVDESLSLAAPPTFSNGNKTVTISMKKDWKWSDGAPVDAQDVIFFIDLLKAAVAESPANFTKYSAGFFPDNVVSATASDQYTVVLQLTKAYNPDDLYKNQLINVTPLPSTAWNKASTAGPSLDYTQPANAKAIYDYLAAQAKDLGTYATNPLWQDVDGQMHLTSFTQSTGAYSMAPNPHYGGPNVGKYEKLDVQSFTSNQAEFNQLLAGNLDIGAVDFSAVPQLGQLKAKYNVFGLPDFGLNTIIFNFKDQTGHFDKIIAQDYVRQALAHLVDQQGYIKGLYHGAAAPAYGPVPAIPTNPYSPANSVSAPYAFSVSQASTLLSGHGWKVTPNGTTTCAKPGTGADECGDGIPAGTAMNFNLFYKNNLPVLTPQLQAFAGSARQVGINIALQSKTSSFINSTYQDAVAPANDNEWAMRIGGFSSGPYPTTFNIFNTTGSLNEGGYSDPKADELINASVYGADTDAVKDEASYLAEQLPALFEPNYDLLFAVKKNIAGTTPNAFTSLTQYNWNPGEWYLTK